jgi:hypothetical protein
MRVPVTRGLAGLVVLPSHLATNRVLGLFCRGKISPARVL